MKKEFLQFADASVEELKKDKLVKEVDGLTYLTKKGYQNAVRLHTLSSLLSAGRVLDE